MREAASTGIKSFSARGESVTLCLCLYFEVLREQVLIEFYIARVGGVRGIHPLHLVFECLGVGWGDERLGMEG